MPNKAIVTVSKLNALAQSIASKVGATLPLSIDQMKTAIDGFVTSLQSKTVAPSESSQAVTADNGYYGLSSVTVGAISASYVGSGISRKSSSDLTASGATISVPAGYYESAASKAVSSGSATTPATSVTANPSISISSAGLVTATTSATQSVTPTVSAGYVSSGTAGTITVTGSNTQQLSTQAAATITPTTSAQTAVASGKYTTGAVTVAAIPNQYIVPSGTKQITSNGTGIDVTSYASVDVAVPTGPDKNIQAYIGYDEVAANTYTATDVSLKVAKTGTYTVSWMGARNSTSGTSGSRLYIGGSAYGTANTTFVRSYGQRVELTGVSLTKDQVITVYARSRTSSYYMLVGNLIIQEE